MLFLVTGIEKSKWTLFIEAPSELELRLRIAEEGLGQASVMGETLASNTEDIETCLISLKETTMQAGLDEINKNCGVKVEMLDLGI